MAHQLIVNYGLYRKMEVYEPHWADYTELTTFHSPEYIEYLEKVSKNPESSKDKMCNFIFFIFYANINNLYHFS